jgi:hypothetical protein
MLLEGVWLKGLFVVVNEVNVGHSDLHNYQKEVKCIHLHAS